jgi:hypothetical protein
MKSHSLWIAGALTVLLTVNTCSQEKSPDRKYFSDIVTIQHADFSKLEKKYAACLDSENNGVVESALAHVAMFKLMYPVKDFSVLKRAIGRVAERSDSQEIRYKAFLVSSLFRNPKQFAGIARTDYESPDELFSALGRNLHDAIVSNLAR